MCKKGGGLLKENSSQTCVNITWRTCYHISLALKLLTLPVWVGLKMCPRTSFQAMLRPLVWGSLVRAMV